MTPRSLVLTACLLGAAAPVDGQSIFNAAGFGLPVEALDGRARALGSFGIGLQGAGMLPTDPAAAARVLLPTGVIVVQPTWVDFSQEGVSDHDYYQGIRFPLLAIAYPVYRGALMLNLASVFDQSYAGQRTAEVELGGTTYPVVDQFEQEGSVSQISLGYARMIGERFSLGFSVGHYAGTVAQSLVRSYEAAGEDAIEPYLSTGSWRYSGESVTGGASVELWGIVRVAGSATWSTDLDANATGETQGGDQTLKFPLQLRLGASAILTPGLNLSASAVRADWSAAAEELGGTAGTTLGLGVGLELSQTSLFGREAPLRLGYRRAALPFPIAGDDVKEEILSGGLALVFSQANGVVLATTDVGVEKGRRTGGGLTEDFWRGTVSLRLAAF